VAVVVVGALLGGARSTRGVERYTTVSRVTYFSLTGVMASGLWTFDGAAACGDALPLYSTVVIHAAWDVTVTCLDRGYLPPYQIDVWSPGRPWWLTDDWYAVDWW
jgi:hypothetical protein